MKGRGVGQNVMNLRNKKQTSFCFVFLFFSAVKFLSFALLSSNSRPNDVPGIYTKKSRETLCSFFFFVLPWPFVRSAEGAEYLVMESEVLLVVFDLCIFNCLFSSDRLWSMIHTEHNLCSIHPLEPVETGWIPIIPRYFTGLRSSVSKYGGNIRNRENE